MENEAGYCFAVRLVVITDDRRRSHAGATQSATEAGFRPGRSRLSAVKDRRLVRADQRHDTVNASVHRVSRRPHPWTIAAQSVAGDGGVPKPVAAQRFAPTSARYAATSTARAASTYLTCGADRGELAYKHTAGRLMSASQRSPENADVETAGPSRWPGRQCR
jgi:hypothetical protein